MTAPGAGEPGPAEPAAILLARASIGYGDVPIVQGVDLVVGRGEAVAVLGSNGSGKTTLVRGVLGLAAVLAGVVEVLGRPVGDRRARARIGYVPQRHTVSGAVPATVREVVSVGRLARLGVLQRPGAPDRAAVTEAVAAVGLADRLTDPVAALSGGQQRRVLVARALAAEPDLLVMDEPTAGVDAASQDMLAEVLARVAAAGTTLVVVTHELGALSGVLTRAVVADHGRIAHDGPLAGAGRAGSGLAGGSHHVDEPDPTAGGRHGGLATPALRLRGGGR
jgi:zinc transport system ATP-binding protein